MKLELFKLNNLIFYIPINNTDSVALEITNIGEQTPKTVIPIVSQVFPQYFIAQVYSVALIQQEDLENAKIFLDHTGLHNYRLFVNDVVIDSGQINVFGTSTSSTTVNQGTLNTTIYSELGQPGTSGTSGMSGSSGSHGTSGKNGVGINIVGALDNPSELPDDAAVNDGYFIGDDLWVYTQNGWYNTGRFNGSSGTSGESGSHGTSGSNGESGTSGTSGLSGSHGTSGESGTHGTSGLTGSSGTSGRDGDNGLSLNTKVGLIRFSDFTNDGDHYYYDVTFNEAYNSAEYAITLGYVSEANLNALLHYVNKTNVGFRLVVSTVLNPDDIIDWLTVSKGESAISGTSGTSGANGTSGINGSHGTSGESGTSGTSGISGTAGTSGISGSSGVSGTSGTSGLDGTSGTSGLNGSSGTSGRDATSGTAGTSGKDTSLVVRRQIVTNDTVLSTDAGKMIETNSSSNITLTLPLNADQPLPPGTQIMLFRFGAGEFEIVPAAGVTLYGANGARLAKRYSAASLVKRFDNIWVIMGDTKI